MTVPLLLDALPTFSSLFLYLSFLGNVLSDIEGDSYYDDDTLDDIVLYHVKGKSKVKSRFTGFVFLFE